MAPKKRAASAASAKDQEAEEKPAKVPKAVGRGKGKAKAGAVTLQKWMQEQEKKNSDNDTDAQPAQVTDDAPQADKADTHTQAEKADTHTQAEKADEHTSKMLALENEPGAHAKGDTDVPDGEFDDRPYSKQQKLVFDRNFSSLDPGLQAEWQILSKPGFMPGKQKRKNQIVNSVVSRNVSYGGSIQPKPATIERFLSITDGKTKKIEVVGISKTAMQAKLGSYFHQGVDSGDCWEGPDGLWYEKTKTESRAMTKKETNKLGRFAEVTKTKNINIDCKF